MSGQNSSWEDLLRAGFSVRNGILHRESGLCTLKELVIPSGIVGIDSGCFRGSPVLRSVTLPETLTELGASAFEDCAALEEILIPSGIGRSAGLRSQPVLPASGNGRSGAARRWNRLFFRTV